MNEFKKSIISYVFVVLLGILLHYTYEWSEKNYIVGLFSATNESTWEHLKLAFFPMLLLTVWDVFHTYTNDDNFLPARTIGILAAMAFIVIAFYTFTGVVGKNVDFVNIIIYLLGIAFGFLVEKHVYGKTKYLNTTGSIIILFVIALLFFIWTYSAPNAGIFKERL